MSTASELSRPSPAPRTQPPQGAGRLRSDVTSPPSTSTPTASNRTRELDFAALTSPSFTNEADWLNSILSPSTIATSSSPSLSGIESTISSTLHSLESSLNDTSTLVDRSIADISTGVPRLAFDLQLMRENALLLRFTLDAVRKRGTGFSQESSVGQVIDKIRKLDLIKQRMEAARDVLREAESWSTLESEVTGLVQEGQYLKASERLAEAARSMVVFQNTAEYEGRRALMVSLQNQLEASLSSGLVKAIQERDVKGCKAFWKIFGMIQREQEFTSYYFGSRRSGLLESWKDAKLLDCHEESQQALSTGATTTHNNSAQNLYSTSAVVTSARLSSPDPAPFSQFMSHFYSELYTLLTEERTYLPAIFPHPATTLSRFVQTTLDSLNPSFTQRLNSIQQTYQRTALFLPELIKVFKLTEEFAVQVEGIFQKLEPIPPPLSIVPPHSPDLQSNASSTSPRSPSLSQPPAAAAANGSPSKRRLSKRRSLSNRLSSRSISFAVGSSPSLDSFGNDGGTFSEGGGHRDDLDRGDRDEATGGGGGMVSAWETALFEPFLDYQTEYARLEKQYLEHELSRIQTTRQGNWIQLVDDQQQQQRAASTATRSTMLDPGPNPSSNQVGPKKLLDTVVKLFILFEDAIGRNLALTHGYGAKGLIEVLDDELVAFLDDRRDELVRAVQERSIGKLRSEQQRKRRLQSQDQNGPGDDGRGTEEDMVLEGLEYTSQDWEMFQFGLKLLDACRRMEEKLNAFEGKLKSRMTMLAKTVKQARVDGPNFTVPGTTRGQILLLRQSTLNSIDLNTMLDGLEDSGGLGGRFLLSRGKGATIEFTRTTQLFLHETLLAPLQAHLSDYTSLPCWTTSSDRTPGAKGAFDLSIPTFSLSPTETISRVGEGLFNLPRLFEVYAQDDALSYSIETLPFVDLEQLRTLQQEHYPDHPPPMLRQSSSNGPHAGPSLSHRSTLSESKTHRPSFSQTALPPLPAAASVSLTAETVIATWLSSLTLSILSHLTKTILPTLSRLTKHGASQLMSDLDYISNVARALDVESPQDLESWRQAVTMEEKAIKEDGALTSSSEGGGGEFRIDREILERVAKIRGLRRGSI